MIDVLLDYRRALSSPRLLVFHLLAFGSAILLSLPMRHVYRRVYRRTHAPLVNLAAALFTSFVLANVWHLFIMTAAVAVDPTSPRLSLGVIFGWEWLEYLNAPWSRLMPFLGWSFLYFAFHTWLDNRDQRGRAELAEQMARQARLEALRYQVNPHFLFNALNTIRAMIIENPQGARQVTTDLASFFRQTLSRIERNMIPVREEIGVVASYLAIEKLRGLPESVWLKSLVDPSPLRVEV